MNESKNAAALCVPLDDADRLLACADGKSALLYLHILRCGGFSLTRASRELRLTEAETALAADNLRRLGLLRDPDAVPGPEELPQYSAGEVADRAKSDPGFEGVILEAQHALGRLLSANDLRILFGIYDHLGLPAEVILLLINHCIEVYRAANGPGRTPTLRYIEKEAWFWVNREIVTLEAAEEHIRLEKLRSQQTEQVKAALQIRGRAPTPSERKYIDSWLELGYSPEALAIAYDRTVLGTGRLTWKYMDKIVRAWSEKRLFTPEEIERGDTRPHGRGPAPAAGKPRQADPAREIESARRLYESMKKGK